MPGVAAAGRGAVVAYDGVVAISESDFTIPRGALTAVIGANGSGKSSLLGCVAGLVKLAAGTVEVFGSAPQQVRNRVAYVLQSTKVNEVMPVTVAEVVRMGRYAELGLFRRLSADDRALVEDAMACLDVTDLAAKHLSELSGGQRQRVFVAQGLAQGSEFLLLDEPVAGFDIPSRERITSAIDGELAAGHTVAFATHDLAEAARADHVILMAGKVIVEGNPDTVLAPDRLAEAFGIGILHLADGGVLLDDAHHRPERHVHYDRRG